MNDNTFGSEGEKTLKYLGLSHVETSIYGAALEMGEALPKHLAEKAGVKRPMLYKLLPDLFEKGLLTETRKGKRRYLVAADPEVYLDKKRSELELAEQSVPELRLLLQTATIKPDVIYYRGVENLKKLYMDNLRQKEEILEIVSVAKIHPEIEHYSKNYYIPQRINRRIPIKIIVSGKTESDLLNLKTGPHFLREVRTMDENVYPIPLDSYIYGDSVSFALYRTDSEPIGVIIRSKEIATTMRSLFGYIWSNLKNV